MLVALLSMLLLAGLAAAVLSVTRAETFISTSYRRSQELFYAGEASLHRTIVDLSAMAVWTPLLADPPGNLTSTFDDGRSVDAAGLIAARQRESDSVYAPADYGADTPMWRLFAHTSLSSLVPVGTLAQPADLFVFVADDGEDGDGDPRADANGRVLVLAEARGTNGGRRQIEALLARTASGTVTILSWRALR